MIVDIISAALSLGAACFCYKLRRDALKVLEDTKQLSSNAVTFCQYSLKSSSDYAIAASEYAAEAKGYSFSAEGYSIVSQNASK